MHYSLDPHMIHPRCGGSKVCLHPPAPRVSNSCPLFQVCVHPDSHARLLRNAMFAVYLSRICEGLPFPSCRFVSILTPVRDVLNDVFDGYRPRLLPNGSWPQQARGMGGNAGWISCTVTAAAAAAAAAGTMRVGSQMLQGFNRPPFKRPPAGIACCAASGRPQTLPQGGGCCRSQPCSAECDGALKFAATPAMQVLDWELQGHDLPAPGLPHLNPSLLHIINRPSRCWTGNSKATTCPPIGSSGLRAAPSSMEAWALSRRSDSRL